MSRRSPAGGKFTWKDFGTQFMVNCVAGVLPAAFLLLLGMDLRPGAIFNSVIIGVVFSNSIGFPARFAIPKLYPAIARRGPVWEWLGVGLALAVLGAVGCFIGTALLAAMQFLPWSAYARVARGNFMLCILITLGAGLVITAFSRLRGRLDSEELARERALKLASEAQLASLESRLQPHFLFNTLNSVSALIPVDPARAERLIERMAALLRFSLDAHSHGLVPLAQEMNVVGDYLEIEQARLGTRLRFVIDFPDGAEETRVPPLAVQILVENSIKHVIAPSRQGGELRIRTSQENGKLRIDVSDSGPGFTMENVPAGRGLDNLRNRLALLFDNQALIQAGKVNGLSTVTLVLPRDASGI